GPAGVEGVVRHRARGDGGAESNDRRDDIDASRKTRACDRRRGARHGPLAAMDDALFREIERAWHAHCIAHTLKAYEGGTPSKNAAQAAVRCSPRRSFHRSRPPLATSRGLLPGFPAEFPCNGSGCPGPAPGSSGGSRLIVSYWRF